MRNRTLALSLLAASSILACGGKDLGPELEGFFSGGFIGAQCPPASEPDGTCSDPDCSVPCVANTPCTPEQTTCPPGTTCDASLDEPYCMPKVCNESSAECASGEYCATQRTSKGLCVLADPTPTPCDGGQSCEWPFMCTDDGSCVLPCTKSECPSGSACVEGSCQPGG